MVAMRRGFALVELVLVIGIAGIVTTIALPPLLGVRDRLAVDSSIYQLSGLIGRARLTAIVEGRPVRLEIRPDTVLLLVVTGTDTVTRWGAPGTDRMPARVSGPARPALFAPTGVTYGVSNATYVVARGGEERRLVISRWGRVRIE